MWAWNGRCGAGVERSGTGGSVVQGPGASSSGTRSNAQTWSQSWFCPCHLAPLAPPPKASQGGSDLSWGKPWVCDLPRKGHLPFSRWVTLCIPDSGLSVALSACPGLAMFRGCADQGHSLELTVGRGLGAEQSTRGELSCPLPLLFLFTNG